MRVAECRTNAPRWTFVGAEDAMTRGFEFLPLHILPTIVYIEPPNPDDPGQLICLCERLQRLVQLLLKMKQSIRSLAIDLVDQSLWIRGDSYAPRVACRFLIGKHEAIPNTAPIGSDFWPVTLSRELTCTPACLPAITQLAEATKTDIVTK